ncbi:MAG: RNA pseudouridine synthase, partial [Bacteroidia bacterium]|nr:RNA pseudouridine synthase [Bacteroidia bacterium]
ILDYRTIAEKDGLSWLEIRPLTGRKHQIRAQLAFVGKALVGDVKYGREPATQEREIALFARSLTVLHPTLRTPVQIVATPPKRYPWDVFL